MLDMLSYWQPPRARLRARINPHDRRWRHCPRPHRRCASNPPPRTRLPAAVWGLRRRRGRRLRAGRWLCRGAAAQPRYHAYMQPRSRATAQTRSRADAAAQPRDRSDTQPRSRANTQPHSRATAQTQPCYRAASTDVIDTSHSDLTVSAVLRHALTFLSVVFRGMGTLIGASQISHVSESRVRRLSHAHRWPTPRP